MKLGHWCKDQNRRVLVGAFNQEKALEAFSVIVKTDCETDGALHSTRNNLSPLNNQCCIVTLFADFAKKS